MPAREAYVPSYDLPRFQLAVPVHPMPYDEAIFIPHPDDPPARLGMRFALLYPDDSYAIPVQVGRVHPDGTHRSTARSLLF
jgi:hypothetical protein